jgi:hypothetical protein
MPTEEEDENLRYAVARDEQERASDDKPPTVKRLWWQMKSERFESDWESRKLFEHKADALALIWRSRASDVHHKHYTFHLVKVTRTPATVPAWLP